MILIPQTQFNINIFIYIYIHTTIHNMDPSQQQQQPSSNTNKEYYDENGLPRYDELISYENKLREEIENTSPLVSEPLDVAILTNEYQNTEYITSIVQIISKYKHIRTTRRDGNCFYRGYLFRLFEEIGVNKDSNLYTKITKVIEYSKEITGKHNYEWNVYEDFYTVFKEEIERVYTIDKEYVKEYLKKLFENKEKGNYLIVFVRLFIAAYLKENKILYENFIFEQEFESWILKEVETVDNECDQIQIMAIVNAFDIGVTIEYLNVSNVDTIMFPEGNNNNFIKLLYRPGHYDILY